MLRHVCSQFFVRPSVNGNLYAVFPVPVLYDFIGAVPAFAFLAVDQRIVEAGDVAGGHPNAGIHQNGAVDAHIVRAFLYEFLPPCFFDVVFQLNAERSVIPAVRKAPVNLGAGIDKSAVCGKSNNFLHCFHTI